MTRSLCLFNVVVLTIAILGFSQSALTAPILYTTNLDGALNGSPGIGTAQVEIDDLAHTLHVQFVFSGLLSPATAMHIHGPTAIAGSGNAGVITQTPTFSGSPLGVTSGSYDNIFDMTLLASFNPSFVTANGGTAASAEAALATSMAAGTAYLNIHTTMFPGGEIRGFLESVLPQAVPEPSTFLLLGAGLSGLALLQRRR